MHAGLARVRVQRANGKRNERETGERGGKCKHEVSVGKDKGFNIHLATMVPARHCHPCLSRSSSSLFPAGEMKPDDMRGLTISIDNGELVGPRLNGARAM